MINLRYHIVSITAVFLALGIGLAFGAAFIDRATVEALNRNLTEIEQRNEELERVNDELARELVAAAEVEAGLRSEGLPQLVAGRLEDVPVLLLASEGAGDDAVAAAEQAVVDAGAETAGILQVTDRFSLDDDDEIEDLRTALGLPGAGAEQLRTTALRRLRGVLLAAARPVEAGAAVPEDAPVPVPMPPLVQSLIDEGFLELDLADDPSGSFALVPARGLRLVTVSGPEAAVADDDFLLPLIDLLVAPNPLDPEAGPPPIVAAQPAIPPADPDESKEPPPPFVEVLRADDAVRERLSTVDRLDPFHGLLAMVLALEHAPSGQRGHYGTSESAQLLLPPPVDPAAGDG